MPTPHDPPPTADDPAPKKQDLEIRKLQAETAVAEHEAGRISRAERMKTFSAVLPAITVLISVLGLLLSLRAQVQQQKRSDADRREDQFTSAVRDFAAGSETAQIAALVRLERFWDEPSFRSRLVELLLASAGTVPSADIRASIQQQLVRHADLGVLSALAAQNLRIADELRERRPNGPFVERYILPARLANLVAGDTTDRKPFDRLAWNIATLVPVMNQIRDIHDIDLSGVVLSRVELKVEFDTAEPGIRRIDRADPIPGLSFRNVSLRKAVLTNILFRGASFSAVNLDSAMLANVMFDSCSFSNGTSLAGFRPWVSFQVPVVGPPLRTLSATAWLRSHLDVAQFYPQLTPHRREHTLADYMQLAFTDWKVAKPPSDEVVRRMRGPFPLQGTRNHIFPTVPLRPR